MTHVKRGNVVDSESFQREIRVSRETTGRLESFVRLLESWQRRINLVGESTRGEIWRRHILDSAQLFPLLEGNSGPLLDIGTGAGFPGLVLAIMGYPNVHLVESNRRKAAFLREACRVTGAPATIHSQRIESLEAFPADFITARALAKVDTLLDYAAPFLHERTVCLFLKGENAQTEVREASRSWSMHANYSPSISDPRGIIVRLEDIRHA